MHRQKVNRISGNVLILLSVIAFLAVLSGYIWGPDQSDEGTAAHIFQLSMLLQLPMVVLFVATADWKRPLLALRPMSVQAVCLAVAFVALFHLEHP